MILYASERVTLHLADALEVLPTIATESMDLVVVDPPYGVEWQSGVRAQTFDVLDGDTLEERDGIREILIGAVRVVGQHRHLYVFGPATLVDGLKVSAPVELIWAKGTVGSGDLSLPWAPAHERITFAVSMHRHGGKAGNESLAARLRKGTIIEANRPTGRKVRHPTEKPVALLRELIESSSRAGEVVFDPCAGIGSTGVAAIVAGRRAVLVEKREEYARIAVDRLRAAEDLADRIGQL